MFVCEEAHRYAAADRNIGFGPTRKAVSRIAKEGRKYGVFLGLVTQRPAELDATIISQCNTLFAMRLANDRDQALLRSAVSDAAANLLSFVPSLGTREVLAFGEGVALPTRLRFKEVPVHQLPRSEATIASAPSVTAGHDMHFVAAVLERWRGATSNRDTPGDASAGGERSASARVMTPAEAPMLQPSMGLDPDRFSLLKKPCAETAGAETAGARADSRREAGIHFAAIRYMVPATPPRGLSRNPFMTKPAAKRFQPPAIDKLPEDIRTRILAVQEKSGFVPNVFLTLAYRPDEFRAFFAYHDALMEKDSGLTKAEREMIVVATSAANQCHYCVIAHGAILRIRAKNPTIADQIAVNYRKADITPRQRAMLDFAMKVSRDAETVSEADFADIAGHGFADDDIWDIAAIAAFFALSNRLANVTAMRPNDEFYMMGRLPKQG